MYLKDHPLKVGKEAQDHPQLKRCWKPPSSCVDSDSHPNDNVHPLRKKNIQTPCISWRCPPKFMLDCNWRVAAGEESQDAKAQKCREGRVHEALYPRPSIIPPSPSMPSDAYDGHLDDSHIPVIPLTPIEEEEEAYTEAPSEASIELQALDQPQATLEAEYLDTPLRDPPVSSELPANVKPDIVRKPGVNADADAAAAAAYTAILKCKEQGSLIDSDLLISILTNPELVQKLIVEHGFSENAVSEPAAALKQVKSSTPDMGPKKSCEECVASANTGTVPVSASPQVTFSVPLLNSHMDTDIRPFIVAPATLVQPNMVTPLVPWNGKPNDNFDVCANTGLVRISGPLTTTSHVSLPLTTTTMKMRFANTRVGEPSSTGSGPLPGPKMVTREVTDESSVPASVGFTPYSWVPSVPFTRSKSTEMLINNLINEFGGSTNTESTQSAGVKPVAPSASLCTSKPDVLECKKLISQYGSKKKGEPILGSDPTTQSVAVPAPEAGTGKLKRPDSQSSLHLTPKNIPHNAPSVAMTAPSSKDMEYFKSLIKKHGDGQETLKVDPVEIGKSRNYLQGPVTSIEQKPTSEKPQCNFFNTSRGCRNGSNCRFQHNVENVPSPIGMSLGAPDRKRMKLSGEFGTKK